MIKICPKCNQKHIQKFWVQDWRQRYKCMDCGYIFRSPRRIWISKAKNIIKSYIDRKQTLAEIASDSWLSKRTIHRRITKILHDKYQSLKDIQINPNLSKYTSSVLILDATFFWKKGSDTQWWILVAQDGITGDILASKHIFQETLEDYRVLLRTMKQEWYPKPHFAVIDGRNGVEWIICDFYDIPVQICQSHKIATIDRYLLKHPRIESYRELKRIAHDMVRTDKTTFIWWLEEFKKQYIKDFEIRELDTKTLKYRYVHPRLLLAYRSLLRDIDRLFVSLPFIQTIGRNINTSNRIECEFSHLKPKVKLHRWLSKEDSVPNWVFFGENNLILLFGLNPRASARNNLSFSTVLVGQIGVKPLISGQTKRERSVSGNERANAKRGFSPGISPVWVRKTPLVRKTYQLLSIKP